MPEKSQNIGETAQSVIRFLDCPCEYFPRGSDLSAVGAAYRKALAERETGGFIPLIIAVEGHMIFEENERSADFQKAVFAAPRIDPKKWFEEKLKEHSEAFCFELSEIVGEISGGEPRNGFSGFTDFGIQKSRECVLAKIPVKEPWGVFARFPLGGWNDCPRPEEMLCIAKYWHEKHGAVPAVMTCSELEFTARPITDKAAALELAREHFAFCPDQVLQNAGTLGKLADTLAKSSVWHFWWD